MIPLFPVRYVALALAGVVLLSGCSSSPSTGDAKKAVEAALGDCKQVEVVDFDKVNGIANGDSHYTLQVKYGLKFAALDDSVKAVAEFNTYQAAEKEKFEQAKAYMDKVRAQNNSGQPQPPSTAQEDQALQDNQLIEAQYPELMQSAEMMARQHMAAALRAACPNLPERIVRDYAQTPLSEGADSIRVDYTNDHLMMVKSDNGWVGE